MSHFYPPWKRQKTYGFLTFSGGMEVWHWTKIILIFTILYFFKKTKKNTWRYHYFTPVYQNSWYRARQTEIGNFRSFFALSPPNNLKNQNFEKIKEAAWDIIILHMCTINDNRMMYDSYDMDFLSFWAIFYTCVP